MVKALFSENFQNHRKLGDSTSFSLEWLKSASWGEREGG